MGCGSSAQPDAQSPAEKDATLSGQTSNPKSDLRLFEASEKGSTNEVRLLLAAAANPNWQNPEWGYCTSLHRSVQENHSDVMQLLLDAAASVEIADTNGWSALHYASQAAEGSQSIMASLLAAGAAHASGDQPEETWDANRWNDIKTI